MTSIKILDHDVIDKIAAGEVVERPASVVKELLENAIDAGATAVTVEIREGGIRLIRVTDNGQGIDKEDVRAAFLRHATSKIRTASDLLTVNSLGFRGEALSSIAAVAQVEMITKTADSLTGTRYRIEGSAEKGCEEIGAPQGTTFLVRNLFYNTPARHKFLKSAATEGGLVSGILEHMAMSRPDISLKFVNNGQVKLHTSGGGSLREVVYQIYGRDIASNLIEIPSFRFGVGEPGEELWAQVNGFLGMPLISRGNRAFETFFVNRRYIRSDLLTKALEEAYKSFLMQHRYPFAVLCVEADSRLLDVNVHPAKMEIRFSGAQRVCREIEEGLRQVLLDRERIPDISDGEPGERKKEQEQPRTVPEPFETKRILRERQEREGHGSPSTVREESEYRVSPSTVREESEYRVSPPAHRDRARDAGSAAPRQMPAPSAPPADRGTGEQLDLFGAGLLTEEAVRNHRIIGQIFETYWLVQYGDELYIIDQHAAHEKVLYERFLRELAGKEMTTQLISPPIIVTVSSQEERTLDRYRVSFETLGFQIEPFGGKEYSIRGVPGNLYGLESRELFLELLDSLSGETPSRDMDGLDEHLASMACKAAVKGNFELSEAEARALIQELLRLENPYNCPHGRPTIVRMSKRELEKKFKRIV